MHYWVNLGCDFQYCTKKKQQPRTPWSISWTPVGLWSPFWDPWYAPCYSTTADHMTLLWVLCWYEGDRSCWSSCYSQQESCGLVMSLFSETACLTERLSVPGVALAPSEIWFPLTLIDLIDRQVIEPLLCVLLFIWLLHGFGSGKTKNLSLLWTRICLQFELCKLYFAAHAWVDTLLVNQTDVLQSVIACMRRAPVLQVAKIYL